MFTKDRRPAPHSHDLPAGAVPTSRLTRMITTIVLAVLAAGTVSGLILLWPDYDRVAEVAEGSVYAVDGVTYERGEILGIEEECDDTDAALGEVGTGDPGAASQETSGACRVASVGLRSGPDAGRLVDVTLRGSYAVAGLQVGDTVELVALPSAPVPGVEDDSAGEEADAEEQEEAPEPDAAGSEAADADADAEAADAADAAAADSARYELSSTYTMSGVMRGLPLAILALVFAAVVIAIGRLRGFLALIALGVAAFVLLGFVLPALVAGRPGLLVALVGASAIMFVILYFVHGWNMRTTAALVGTLCGILIMAAVSLVAVATTRLSGIGDEASGQLSTMAAHIDFRGLLTCAIIIAGLGILNDVTITQASSVWELRAAAPEMPRSEIYARAMRIGRDHLASTVYTVFFSYVGAAMGVLILLYLYDRPLLSLLSQEDIAIEVVRTLCGSIGLMLAIPITTWVAARFVPPAVEELSADRRWTAPAALRGADDQA